MHKLLHRIFTVTKMLAFLAMTEAYQVMPTAGRAQTRSRDVQAAVGLVYSTTTGARSLLPLSERDGRAHAACLPSVWPLPTTVRPAACHATCAAALAASHADRSCAAHR